MRKNREYHGESCGLKASVEYQAWRSMVNRCCNSRADRYAYYGGRGIRVCDRWRWSFAAFLSDLGRRPQGMTLDRIDNYGAYSPENCRWATRKEQCRNRRTTRFIHVNGERMSLVEAAERTGMTEYTLRRRLA